MCAIAGLYHADMPAERRVDTVRRMLAYLRHRGPDEMGYCFDQVAAMGAARLSIVDISGGQQPIADASGRFWIAFNGEIYNYKSLRAELERLGHRLQSNSDTEVLLYAWVEWGERALSRLNGAFAFSIYDSRRRTLFLARDRFGKRPLYYRHAGQTLIYGSEMKSFLACEGFRFEFDSEQLASIFRIWTPVDDQSGFKDIRQVPAGSYLEMGEQGVRVIAYAPLSLSSADEFSGTEAEAIQLLRDKLTESVRLRLSADVEVATYLSGGLDSAIITSLVVDLNGGRKTFSVEFADAEFDESADQHLMAQHLGTSHSSLSITSQDIVDAFPLALWHAEVPVFRTAFVPMFLLSRLVRSQGIKVVLTGEGADEAFLGYDIFKETLLRQMWPRLSATERRARLSGLYPYLPHFNAANQASLTGFFERFSQQGVSELFSHDLRFHNSHLSTRLLAEKHDSLSSLTQRALASHEQFRMLSPVQKAQWLEFKTLLGGYLLSTQGDRMGLANSVENRCPFLDPAVVRAGAATNLKFNDGFDEKYLLKKAFAGRLPSRLLTKHKQPYRAPDAAAFLRARPEYLERIRSVSELSNIDVLDAKFCRAFAEKVLAKDPAQVGQAENQTFIFLLSVVLLHDFFVARKAAAPAPIDDLLVTQLDRRLAA